MRSHLTLLVVCASLAALAIPASAAVSTYLINFGDDTYTTDGTNAWNSPATIFFENVTPTGSELALADTAASTAAGLEFAVTARGATQAGWMATGTNTDTGWATLSWFDSTSAAQRAFLNVWNGASETWTVSGLAATDTIKVQWISNHSATNTNRTIDVQINGIFSNVIGGNAVSSDNFATEQASNNKYFEWALTPDANGNLVVNLSAGAGATKFGAWANAVMIEVTSIPEPGSATLLAMGAASLLVRVRRRKQQA